MKINRRSAGVIILATLIAVGIRGITSNAQAMELQLVERAGSITRLDVTNAGAGNVNLQGSFDLENWFHIQSAAAVLGVASFTHINDEPIDTWFFRAVAAPAPVAIN